MYIEICGYCNGNGERYEGLACYFCHGSGEIMVNEDGNYVSNKDKSNYSEEEWFQGDDDFDE